MGGIDILDFPIGPKLTLKVAFNTHPPPKTFKVVPGKLGPRNFV